MSGSERAAARFPVTRLLIVIAVVIVLGGLFLYGLLRGSPDRDIESALLGETVPAFALPVHASLRPAFGATFDFDPTSLDKPAVINFWATWCLPCRDEAPVLEAAWREFGDDVTIIGIQTQDSGNARGGQGFINEFDLTFPNVIDDPTRTSIDWGLFGVPETYFVRADGTLAYKHVGQVTAEVMEERIGELIR